MDIEEVTEGYVWIIKWLDVSFHADNNLIDVIKRVHWIRSYVKANTGVAEIHGITHLPIPNPTTFLEISNINLDTIKSWLNSIENTISIDQALSEQMMLKDHQKTKVVILTN